MGSKKTTRGNRDNPYSSYKKRVKLLEELYSFVPDSNCKGLCTDQCKDGLVTSETERERAQQQGFKLKPYEIGKKRINTDPCPALSEGRCSIYESRPMICRTYGSVAGQGCPHGCRPTEGFINAEGSLRLLFGVLNATGNKQESAQGAILVGALNSKSDKSKLLIRGALNGFHNLDKPGTFQRWS